MPSDECRRRRLWKISRYSKIAFDSSTRVFHRFRSWRTSKVCGFAQRTGGDFGSICCETIRYRPTPFDDPDSQAYVDRMFREKYGRPDQLRGWVMPRDTVPIRLERP